MRVTAVNSAPIANGDYVLYWMIAARRTTWSFALDHAIARAAELDRPLIVFEPLRVAYPWASARLHAFVMQGMEDNARGFAAAGIAYHPYIEAEPEDGKGLLRAFAERACLVVTDEQPGFFLPRMVAAAGRKLRVRLEQVDGNGILPLRASDRAFPTAAGFRWHLQRVLPPHLLALPRAKLGTHATAKIPASVRKHWPARRPPLFSLPIDHAVRPVSYRGGAIAARAALREFLDDGLAHYGEDRAARSSGLSPYLHFGHISAHEIVAAVLKREGWDPSRLAAKPSGSREGWWGASPATEAFLDELITWRELGYGFCFHRADYDRYESLPDWARATLDAHASDPRPVRYTRAKLERAETHDEMWNVAQRQLVTEGRIHGYLRMLWGKKILEWSKSPRAALATLVELNNKYAIDGRDPNSYSGIFWTLGRFDRPWAPTREIFGCVRYMSSEATRRKLR